MIVTSTCLHLPAPVWLPAMVCMLMLTLSRVLSIPGRVTTSSSWPWLSTRGSRMEEKRKWNIQFPWQVSRNEKDYWLFNSDSEYQKKTKLHYVNIFFKSPTFDEITEDAKTNFVTKISVLGGSLGLFAGFSLLSGVELLYFFFTLLCKSGPNLITKKNSRRTRM